MGGATLYIEARGGLENDLSLKRFGNQFNEAAVCQVDLLWKALWIEFACDE